MNSEQVQYLVLFAAGIAVVLWLIWREDSGLALALLFGGIVGGLIMVATVVIVRAGG